MRKLIRVARKLRPLWRDFVEFFHESTEALFKTVASAAVATVALTVMREFPDIEYLFLLYSATFLIASRIRF